VTIYCVVINSKLGDCWYIEAENQHAARLQALAYVMEDQIDADESATWEIQEMPRPFRLSVFRD